MTRSSVATLHQGFEDPERELRRRLRAQARADRVQEFDYNLEELFREVEIVRRNPAMADLFSDEEGEERMTLEEYANRPRRGQKTGV
ncbi:hypothetical protein E9993_22860, partial [Labilibacter sediminis]